MSVQTFQIVTTATPGLPQAPIDVHVHKRKGTKTLRLSISSDGKVRVTIPAWAPFREGLRFAHARLEWIHTHMPVATAALSPGQHIGKAHRLVFETDSTSSEVRSRIAGSEIRIVRPTGMTIDNPAVQLVARKACIRALRLEAQKLLPPRLKQLAASYGFTYNSVQVKQLKGRWGSCDNKQHIVLNLFLMQLPWHLIDYVLVHELTHTKHLNHSSDFWAEFLRCEPKAKVYRTVIRQHQPVLAAVEANENMQ